MKPRAITPALLDKYLANECTEEERKLVEDWYASLDGERRYLDHLPDSEHAELQSETYQNIRKELDFTPAHQTRKISWGWISAAASVLIALGLLFIYNKQNTRPLTVAGELERKAATELVHFTNAERRIVTHRLPDSSTVTLQPGAVITYPKTFDTDSRLVTFAGEAFFDIQKDKKRPFYIQSGEMVIKVLGTSFNVKAQTGKKVFEVAVVTGRVEVSARGDAAGPQHLVVLHPRQEALFELSSKKLISKTVLPQIRKPIYEPVTINFEETPVSQVITQLEKRFDVQISLSNPGLAKCSVTANFESQPLSGILEMLCTTLEASYVLSENQITIHGAPCE